MFGKQKQMGRWIAIAVAMGLVCASHVSAQKPPKPPKDEPLTYKMVQLSSNVGDTIAINQLTAGAVEVVGRLRDDSGGVSVYRPHYWMVDATGNIVWSEPLLTDPESTYSYPLGINNYGVVVGNQRVDQWSQPILWPDFLSAPIKLPLPEGVPGGSAFSINDAGIVVGQTYHPDDDPEPVVKLVAWEVDIVVDEQGRPTVTAQDQDPLIIRIAPMMGFHAQIVNRGFVCASIDQRAFRFELGWDEDEVWVEDSETQLLDFPADAYGVNEAGSVCGRYYCPTRGHIAYLKTVSDPVVDLPGLPAMKQGGTNYSATRNHVAYALNNAIGVRIIGDASRSYTLGNYQHWEGGVPLRWDIDANGVRVVDLRTVTDGSPDLYSVGDINDAGWITSCTRVGGNSAESPVLLIPKP